MAFDSTILATAAEGVWRPTCLSFFAMEVLRERLTVPRAIESIDLYNSLGLFNGVEIHDLGPEKGRGLMAVRDIRRGEVIFEERPTVRD